MEQSEGSVESYNLIGGNHGFVVPVFRRINFCCFEKKYQLKVHEFSDFAMIVPLRDAYHCTLNNVELKIQPGEVLFLQPGDLHKSIFSQDIEYLVADFNMERTGALSKIKKMFGENIYPSAQVVTLTKFDMLVALDRYRRIGKLQDNGIFTSYVTSGIMQSLFWEALCGMRQVFVSSTFMKCAEESL